MRPTLLALLVPLLFAPFAAHADVATVPGTHTTIQAAIDAVKSTPGARVEINGNGPFNEMLTIADSMEVVAGAGFTPVIRSPSGSTIHLVPNATDTRTIVLRGLDIRGSGSSDTGQAIVSLVANNSGEVNVALDHVRISNDLGEEATAALSLRSHSFTGSGPKHITLTDSEIVINSQPGYSSVGISMAEGGSLSVSRSQMRFTGSMTGFDLRGYDKPVDFTLTDSTVEIAAPQGRYSSELARLSHDVASNIRRNHFTFQPSEEGSVDGIWIAYNTTGRLHTIAENTFQSAGGIAGSGVHLMPYSYSTPADGIVRALIANNIMSGLQTAVSLSPQDPGDSVEADILNNTIDGGEVCLSIGARTNTSISGRFENNLCTNMSGVVHPDDPDIKGAIAIYSETGTTLGMSLARNGYHNNAHAYAPTSPLVTDIGALVTTNPLYVNRAAGDFRLSSGSPAIDAAATDAAVSIDHAGTARPVGVAPDIGALEAPSVPPPGVPDAPTLTTLLPGNASALISFTPPTTGGSPITGYTARCVQGASEFTATASASPIVVTGLTNGLTYSCTVSATNGVGVGAPSAAGSVTPGAPSTAVPPSAPTLLAALPGNGRATLAFTPPAFDGGSPVTAYLARCAVGERVITASGSTSPIVVSGLANGVSHSCTVTASNLSGPGPASAALAVIPAAGPAPDPDLVAVPGLSIWARLLLVAGTLLGALSTRRRAA